MRLDFSGEVLYWKGPSPWHFVAIPAEESDELRAVSIVVSYGWGVIPVVAKVGATTFETSLFPKDGAYLVPLKTVVRRAEGLSVGDVVRVILTVGVSS